MSLILRHIPRTLPAFLVLLGWSAALAGPSYNYPDTTPTRSIGLAFQSYTGSQDAMKTVLGLKFVWCDDLSLHRGGIQADIAFGKGPGEDSDSFFFHDVYADYYYTAFRGVFSTDDDDEVLLAQDADEGKAIDQEEVNENDAVSVEVRVGLNVGLTTVRWSQFKPDMMVITPGVALDVGYWRLFWWTYVGLPVSPLFTDAASASSAAFYESYDSNGVNTNPIDNYLLEVTAGTTVGIYLIQDRLGLMVEPAIKAALSPVTGLYAFASPGLFYRFSRITIGAVWAFGLNQRSQDLMGDLGLRVWAGVSF